MSSLVPDTSYVLLYPQSFHKLGIIIVPVFQMGPWGSQKLSNLAQKPLASKQQRWDVNSVWWQQILGVSPPHIAPHSAVTAAPSTPTLPHWLPLDHWDGEAVSYTLHWFISNYPFGSKVYLLTCFSFLPVLASVAPFFKLQVKSGVQWRYLFHVIPHI